MNDYILVHCRACGEVFLDSMQYVKDQPIECPYCNETLDLNSRGDSDG